MLELPGYTIIKEIGRGGMAKVYLARHEGLDRDVAIKVMFPNLAADKSYSERFIREARIVAKLSHHNIVTVFDVGIHEQYHYIAMEFLPGITLDDKIKSGITDAQILRIIKEISAGLFYAHDKGFIHRDIKPENILFRENGTAVITDFGIARATKSETKMTAVGTVIGTAHYMSPEQAQGKELSQSSDIYSIGIMLYEMFTGKVPYDADSTIAIVFKHIDAPIPELEGEQKNYQLLLNTLMAKLPEDRYKTCNDIIKDIEEIERGSAPSRATEVYSSSDLKNTEFMPSVKGKKSSRAMIAVIISLIAVIAAGAYFTLMPQNNVDKNNRSAATSAPQVKPQITKEQQLAQKKRIESEQRRREKALIEATKNAILAEQKVQLKAEAKRLEQVRFNKLEQNKKDKARKEKLRELSAEKQKLRQEKLKKHRKKVARLLKDANKKLNNKQLKEAYRAYKNILKIEPKSKPAKTGIQRIAGQYLQLAHAAALKDKFADANTYFKNAVNIAPGHIDIAQKQDEIYQLKRKYQQKLLDNELKAREKKAQEEAQKPVEPAQPKRRSFGSF